MKKIGASRVVTSYEGRDEIIRLINEDLSELRALLRFTSEEELTPITNRAKGVWYAKKRTQKA
jgi:hypothetical protein